jgi:hypothetical protein
VTSSSRKKCRYFFGTTDTDFSFDPQWLVENTKLGISVLRIVRRVAQILTNSGCLVKVLELLLELDAVAIHNFLPQLRLEVEPMAGIEPATDGLRNRCSTTELHWLESVEKLGQNTAS